MTPINLNSFESKALRQGATMLAVAIKPQPIELNDGEWKLNINKDDFHGFISWTADTLNRRLELFEKYHVWPYAIGDRVPCKEALNILDWDDSEARTGAFVQYAADGQGRGWTHDEESEFNVSMDWGRPLVAPPSGFLTKPIRIIPARSCPLWAIRTHVTILSARPVRVQDVTEEEALAMGHQPYSVPVGTDGHCEFGSRLAFAKYFRTRHKGKEWLWLYGVRVEK